MAEKIIQSFSVKRLEILDHSGSVDESLSPRLSHDQIRTIYEKMVFMRSFDQRALSLQREGRIGTYASFLGQEASQIGSAFATRKGDWIFPTFRESGVYLALDHPPYKVLQYWAGDERGLRTAEGLNIFPVSIPVASQIPHAVGAAMAATYRQDPIAVLAYFGDGGTSKGDFHEGLNFAGVFRAPVVFICENNQWAISVPRERQTAAGTIAQKAIGYGFEGIQVDGNDVLAVYSATDAAMKKARGGGGPTLIECFTYRMSDHTTADDASRYRKKEETELWKERDPILRFERYMERIGIWSQQYRDEVAQRARLSVDEAEGQSEAIASPEPRDMFLHTYGRLTQRQEVEIKDF